LQFGSAFHEGVEVLFANRDMTHSPNWLVDQAVERAHDFLQTQFLSAAVKFDGEETPDLQYSREEQFALAEALLRGWWAFEGESFLRDFEIVEVEREGRADLAPELTLMFRPDALVRERASGDLYVISWKTRAKHDKRSMEQDRHDMQSMSEVWGLQQSQERRIEGVLYKYALKGIRRKDNWDGLWKQNCHLIYGWHKLGDTPEEDDWSWRYAYPKEDGSGESRLGKGWKLVPIWRDYPGGVKAWIDALYHRSIFPRFLDALAEVFPSALPVERRVDEVERWRRQVIHQEKFVAEALEILRPYQLVGLPPQELLDELFPQYTHSCHSFSGCPFIPICHEGAAAEVGELYQIRSANHPEQEDSND